MINLTWFMLTLNRNMSQPNRCWIAINCATGWAQHLRGQLSELGIAAHVHATNCLRIKNPLMVCKFLRLMDPSPALAAAITRYETALQAEPPAYGVRGGSRPPEIFEEQVAAAAGIAALLGRLAHHSGGPPSNSGKVPRVSSV